MLQGKEQPYRNNFSVAIILFGATHIPSRNVDFVGNLFDIRSASGYESHAISVCREQAPEKRNVIVRTCILFLRIEPYAVAAPVPVPFPRPIT